MGENFLIRGHLFVKGVPYFAKSGPNRVYLKSALKMAVIFALAKNKAVIKVFEVLCGRDLFVYG